MFFIIFKPNKNKNKNKNNKTHRKVSIKMTSNNTRTVVSNTLVNSIVSLVDRRTTPWVGTLTDLITQCSQLRGKVPSNWPASPSALRVVLNRVIRRVRAEGISVHFTRTRSARLVEFSVR